MSSFLEDKLSNAIASGFKNKLLTGTLSRISGETLNEYGDIVSETTTTYSVEGFIDNYSDVYIAQAGIPETDSKVILILGNCETEPLKDDTVSFANWPTMKIRKVKIDPARATAECQSFNVD